MAQAKTNYDLTVYPVTALVRSASNGAAAHQVTLPSCDCADFINRRGQLVEVGGGIAVTLCKHIAEALIRVGGWTRPEPPAQPVTVHGRLLYADALRRLCEHPVGITEPQAVQLLNGVAIGIATSMVLPEGGTVIAEYDTDAMAGRRSPSRYRITIPF
jgi:hypothetical protein